MGAEIGVHRGDNAYDLLCRWVGQKLLLVDPYTTGYSPKDFASAANRDREADFAYARKKLAPFAKRTEFMRMSSVDAAARVADESMDFVYIDGNHEYSAVVLDLTTWWPKLKDGGVLAGHDIVCPGEPDGCWEETVQPAVLKFARKHDRILYLVVEEKGWPWSWYLVR